MSADILNNAQRMLLDMSGVICTPIRNGVVDCQGRKYQLSFNVRQDAYHELVATMSQYHCVARPSGPYDYLFGIPLSVVYESDAPLVELVMRQEEGADA